MYSESPEEISESNLLGKTENKTKKLLNTITKKIESGVENCKRIALVAQRRKEAKR